MKGKSIKKFLAVILCLLIGFTLVPVSVLAAPPDEYRVTNQRTKKKYDDLEAAVKEAKNNDTIELGKGHYTLYHENKKDNINLIGKNLTFVGKGSENTFWGIGAKVPDPSKFGTEFNGDYSFDGARTITFKNMTLQSSTADYLGFIRADNTVVEDCIINGKTFYWGYTSATFKNTTFNAPGGDYALWTYSSPLMNFDGCTFNSSGKTINVYSDYTAKKNDITINFSNCTVNSKIKSSIFTKTVLNINDSNKGERKFYINLSGKNTINGKVFRDTAKPSNENHTATCSRWFGFGGKQDQNNTGRTIVRIDGTTVFENGKMLSHEVDTANDQYTDGYKDNAYTTTEWQPTADNKQFNREKICNYCKHKVSEKGYQLSYDPNGGEWAGGSKGIKKGAITPISKKQHLINPPFRAGYQFKGWQLEGKEKIYQFGEVYDEINNNEEFINGKLMAIWKEEPVSTSKPEPEDKTFGKINGYYPFRPYFLAGKNSCQMIRDWSEEDVQEMLDQFNAHANWYKENHVPDVDQIAEHINMHGYELLAKEYNNEYGTISFRFGTPVTLAEWKDLLNENSTLKARFADPAEEAIKDVDKNGENRQGIKVHNKTYYVPVYIDYKPKKYKVFWEIVPNQTSIEQAMGYWPGRDINEEYDRIVGGSPFNAELWAINHIGKSDPCKPNNQVAFPLPDYRIHDKGGLWFYAPAVAPKAVKIKDTNPTQYKVTFEYIFAGTETYQQYYKK